MIKLSFDALNARQAEALVKCYHDLVAVGASPADAPILGGLENPPAQPPSAAPVAQIETGGHGVIALPTAAPVAAAPAYTLQQLAVAAAPLLDAGRVVELQTLIRQFGVDSLTALPPERYGEYATALRSLGARI